MVKQQERTIKQLIFYIFLLIILCSLYAFFLSFVYAFGKKYNIKIFFLISFVLNLLIAFLLKKRLLLIFIYAIVFNFLYAIAYSSYLLTIQISRIGIEKFFSSIGVSFIFKVIWFCFLPIFLMGNWLFPFIKLCLKRIFTYVKILREMRSEPVVSINSKLP